MMTCQEEELDSVEQMQIPVRQVMLHLAECQIRCNEMWEAAPDCKVPTLQLCFSHQTRCSGTKVGPFCSKRAENRPHGRDAKYPTQHMNCTAW
jgi:hypothetical protein